MNLVQISEAKGRINRVKAGESPLIELHLEDHQRVICVEMRQVEPFNTERVTRDFVWRAFIETRL